MKKFIFSWVGFCFVIIVSFVSCGLLILILSKADSSFNRLIVSRHNSLIPLANITCPNPDALSKEQFLNEVRYLGNLKEDFDLLDEGILGKIFSAFQLHPWVFKVVDVQRDGLINLKVLLEFRIPALVVPLSPMKDQIETPGNFRVVDVNGVILPKNANPVGLPVLANPLPFPTDKAGVQWKNEQVILCSKILGHLSGVVLPKDCLVELKEGAVLIYSEKHLFKLIWPPLLKDEKSATQEIDERKNTFKTQYSSWIESGKIDGFVLDFSRTISK